MMRISIKKNLRYHILFPFTTISIAIYMYISEELGFVCIE